MKKIKDEIDTTTNSRVYRIMRRNYLESICELYCARCLHHGMHVRWYNQQRNWKHYRKTQYKPVIK
jgi:hypothetical protein